MTIGPNKEGDSNDRLEQTLADYLRSVEAGEPLDQQRLIDQHPDLAGELRSFFANRAALDRVARPLAAFNEPTIGVEAPADVANRVRYFGDYELLEEIARGGMGVVYRARQASLNRIVAVKMILSGNLAGPDDLRRFRAEAEAAARLEHPHVVPIYEIGEHDGQPYFSMAFVNGESLAQRVAREIVAPKEAATIMLKVARAIAYAHASGVVHRDLKPANILMDRAGEPHVTDFGLAKQFDAHDAPGGVEHQNLTNTGQILGTPSYMSPEQAAGKSKELGPPTDVYALGAVLYCLIAGRPPFQAANPVDTILQVIDREPVSPRVLNPVLPRDLETICLKCLEKEPRQRYHSAADMADELQRFINDEPIRARPAGPAERAWRWMRKQRRGVGITVAAVAATVLVTVLGSASWFWYQDWRLGRLLLKTDHPPIVAELLDEQGQLAAPTFTVPTQEPLAVPAGEYRVRLSAAGRMSQSYRFSIERGSWPTETSLNVDDQLLAPAPDGSAGLAIERDYALVARGGRADVVLLDAKGIRRPGWPGDGAAWSLSLDKPAENPRLQDAPRFRWPWHDGVMASDLAHAAYRPQIVADAPDLDGDGLEDIIVAARHQAWVLTLSSRDGGVLWIAARGVDVKADPTGAIPSYSNRTPSAVLGAPIVVADVDHDGAPDLLATFADESRQQELDHRRWMECLSGKTGQTLWRLDLDDAWFQLPKGVETPDACRWMVSVSGSGGRGGSYSNDLGDVHRQFSPMRLSGDSHPGPYPALIAGARDKPLAIVACGARVIVIDVLEGRLVSEPIDLGLPPLRPPQLIQDQGDSNPDLLILQDGDESTTQNPQLKVSRWPLSGQRTARWQRPIAGELTWIVSSPLRAWPVIEDLDGDGQSEVIVPNRTWNPNRLRLATEVEVVDGATGQSRWRRSLKMMDPQIDAFLCGPDLNGDGRRDVLVATLVGERYDLYVDALSGVDGQTIWSSSRRIGQSAYIEDVILWGSGDDGWPRLLVSLSPDHAGLPVPKALAFSTGTGEFLGAAPDVHELRLSDADGDGQSELFLLGLNNTHDPHQGGRLHVLRGVANERWRRFGGNWQIGADYDRDGQKDLLAMTSGHVCAISGRDGRRLWSVPHDTYHINALKPLDVDLDGDGASDVLVYAARDNSITRGPTSQFPVVALSGRTGEKLWNVEMLHQTVGTMLFMEARDIDGDGASEVLFSTFADWDFPLDGAGANRVQHWLAVVEGRTGAMRWRQPLSVAYGIGVAPTTHNDQTRQADVRPAFADLNGDGLVDLVLPAEVVGSPATFEWRACSGKDGATLWSRPMAPPVDTEGLWQSAVPPAVADLDGDGRLEFIGMDYLVARPPNANEQRHARLFVLDAATGAEKWSWQTPVEFHCGETNSVAAYQAARPRPLVLARRGQRPLVAVGLSGYFQPARIVLLDHAGKLFAEWSAQAAEAHLFRPWVCDLDLDGADDLVVVDSGKLRAIQIADGADGKASQMWQWPKTPDASLRLIDVLPAMDADPAVAIVQSGATLYGIEGKTGAPRWINPGPQPLSAGGSLVGVAPQLLDTRSHAGTPSAVFQWSNQVAVCRQARRWDEATTRFIDEPAPTAAVLARLGHSPAPDARYRRVASWARDLDRRAFIGETAWNLVLATFVLMLPGWVLFRMASRRQWSLRAMLWWPLLILLLMIVLRAPIPLSLGVFANETIGARLMRAFAYAPVILFIGLLIRHATHRRWRRLMGWSIALFVVTCLVAVVSTLKEFLELDPGESIDFAAWDILLAMGFYGASWLGAFVLLFSAGFRLSRRLLIAKNVEPLAAKNR